MSRPLRIIVSSALFVTVFLFWAVAHPESLSFYEQYQMFLFSWDYLFEHLVVAGGMAEYAAEFLVQFNYYPTAGAALAALLFVGLQVGVWQMGRGVGADGSHYGLSLIPPALMLAYMGDENVKPVLLFALTALAFAAAAYGRLRSGRWRAVAQVVAIPALYQLFGPSVVVYAAFCAAADARGGKWLASAGVVAYTAAIMYLASQTWMCQYPPSEICFGHNYHNNHMTTTPMLFAVEVSILLTPLAMALLPRMGAAWAAWAETAAVGAAATFVVINSYSTEKYDILRLDSLVRGEKWDEIIAQAEKSQPREPTGISAVNLALAMRGELCEKMFSFNQIGPQGLLAASRRDQFSSLPTAEALFRLGMVNMAQQYFFDLQEAIIDCRKSSRLSKRIAETLIVNGRYEMARKYLCRLKQTLFYSQWARKAEALLGNEAAIDSHPVWGRLRKLRFKSEFYMNFFKMGQLLDIAYEGNHDNRMALDYSLAQCLLLRDIQSLWSHLMLAKEAYGNQVPRHVQEAVMIAWSQSHKNLNGVPVAIAPDVKNRFVDFIKIYSANPNDPRLQAPEWRKTYWHYLLLQKSRNDANTGATRINDQEQVR